MAGGGGGGGASSASTHLTVPAVLLPDVLYLNVPGNAGAAGLLAYVSMIINSVVAAALISVSGGTGPTAGTSELLQPSVQVVLPVLFQLQPVRLDMD